MGLGGGGGMEGRGAWDWIILLTPVTLPLSAPRSDGEVPETLSYLVSQCNNEIWYGDKKGLTAEKIMDFVSDGKFGEGNLPIASDEDEEWFIILGKAISVAVVVVL